MAPPNTNQPVMNEACKRFTRENSIKEIRKEPPTADMNLFHKYKEPQSNFVPLLGRTRVLTLLDMQPSLKTPYFHLGDVLNTNNRKWDFSVNAAYIRFLVDRLQNHKPVQIVLQGDEGELQLKVRNEFHNFIKKQLVSSSFEKLLTANLSNCDGNCCVLAVELHHIIHELPNYRTATNCEQRTYLILKDSKKIDESNLFYFFEMTTDKKADEIDLFSILRNVIDPMMYPSNAEGGNPRKNKKLVLGRWRNVYMVKVADAPKKIAMVRHMGQLVPLQSLLLCPKPCRPIPQSKQAKEVLKEKAQKKRQQ